MSSSSGHHEDEDQVQIGDGLDSVFFRPGQDLTTDEGDLSGEMSLPLNDLSVLPPFLPGLSSLPEDPPQEEGQEQVPQNITRTTPVRELVQVGTCILSGLIFTIYNIIKTSIYYKPTF
jgi:hypothetical protein